MEKSTHLRVAVKNQPQGSGRFNQPTVYANVRELLKEAAEEIWNELARYRLPSDDQEKLQKIGDYAVQLKASKWDRTTPQIVHKTAKYFNLRKLSPEEYNNLMEKFEREKAERQTSIATTD